MSTDEKAKPQEKRLRIIACSSVFTGKRNGIEMTIYEVEAETENGTLISVPLRSFEELPLELIDVTVTKYVSQQYGTSYTLSRKNKNKATRQRVEALERTVTELDERVAQLESGGNDHEHPNQAAHQLQDPRHAG